MTGKQRILAAKCDRADGTFDGIVVDLDAAILQEQAQSVPVFGDVFQGLAKRRLRRDTGAMMIEPDLDGSDDWRRLFLACGQPCFWSKSAESGLDPVKLANEA